jgi:transposase-like protein
MATLVPNQYTSQACSPKAKPDGSQQTSPASSETLMCPAFPGVGLLDDHGPPPERITSTVPKKYPPEFRRKVLDLVAAGRPVAQVAADLAISDQTVYAWRRQELIDTGQLAGTTSNDNAELIAARKRIAQLEAELAIHRRAAELLGQVVAPKGVSRRSR